MKSRRLGLSGLVLLGVCLSGIPALAQKGRIKVDVGFKFSASGESFAPGQYEIMTDPQGAARMRIRSLPNGSVTFLTYATRLGERKSGKPELVFDRDGDNAYLAEIHIPGMDGFLLKGAPGEHKHSSVNASGQ